jgi:hypothetical protein
MTMFRIFVFILSYFCVRAIFSDGRPQAKNPVLEIARPEFHHVSYHPRNQ